MVTPRTGRPRGRPKKAKAPKPPRSRGRPPRWLADRPDRHLLAFAQAALECSRLDISERALTVMFAGLRFGRLILTPENIEAIARGEPFLVGMEERESRAAKHGCGRRHENAFHPLGDDIARLLRGVRNAPPTDRNRRWLARMTKAWLICMDQRVEDAWLARELAADAGSRPISSGRWSPCSNAPRGRRSRFSNCCPS